MSLAWWCRCRPLLSLTWPELVRHHLEDSQVAAPLAETREALDALRRADYVALSSAHRLALLEALTHAVADTEQMRKCAPATVVHKVTWLC